MAEKSLFNLDMMIKTGSERRKDVRKYGFSLWESHHTHQLFANGEKFVVFLSVYVPLILIVRIPALL